MYDSRNRNSTSIQNFIDGDYTKANSTAIPILLTDWQKLVQNPAVELTAHYNGAVKQINRDFKKVGLDVIPEKC